MIKLSLAVSFFFYLATGISAQQLTELRKSTTPIILDGKIDEPIWDLIEPFPMTQFEPVYKAELSEKTDIRVTYDDEFLYVAGKMYTKDASTIAANSLYRDRYSGDDVFAIIIDPFNDNQNAFRFFTTPAGVLFDQAISNDANSIAGSNPVNSSWNTFWDVATTQNEEGWFAEIRIPLSSIGFQSKGGKAEMGLIVYRWLAYHNERHIFPAIPPIWDRAEVKPSQAHDVLISGVQVDKPVYFTPYGLVGLTRLNELQTDSASYFYDDEAKIDVGFDLRYNLTSNLTLDVTINTDFAQVENDDQQLNLTRFSLLFPEKRQFFQQRSGLFDFNFGRTRVFYSRRIGLDDSGIPVRILGGARLTGRIKDFDIGFINLQTAKSDDLSSENFNVLRIKKNVLNPASFIGGIFTSRLGAEDGTNIVAGLDGDFNIFGDDFIEFRASQSYDAGTPEENKYDIEDNSIFRLTWQRRATIGLFYRFFVNRTGNNFEPGIGFYRTVNTSDYFYRLGYGWLGKESSIFRQHSVNIGSFNIFENETFNLRSRFVSVEWNTDFKDAGSIQGEFRYNQEQLLDDEDFKLLGQIHIPVDDYDFFEGRVSYRSPGNLRFRTNAGFEFGEFYDGNRVQFNIEPRFIANINLELSGYYQITNLDFDPLPERTVDNFTAHLAQLRAQYAFNKQISTSIFFQYGNVSGLTGFNFRFRYIFSEGRDLWLVINQQSYNNRDQQSLGLPNLPVLESGSILVKYNHTFAF